VQDIIPTGAGGSFSCIYGPSGCGKTFLAMGLCMSVASGVSWHGKMVKPGFAVYVSGEGIAGLGQRARAWLLGHGLDASDVNVAWLLESIPIYSSSEEIDQLLERFDELQEQPALVIIDTLARCFQGDENETQDMSDFVKGVDRIRTECGSAVVAIHHTNASEGRERGNGALRAATDTMIQVMPGALGARGAAAQGLMTVTCNKQKEALPFATGIGRLQSVPDSGSVRVHLDWMKEQHQ
jgi:RecA-family ATPase